MGFWNHVKHANMTAGEKRGDERSRMKGPTNVSYWWGGKTYSEGARCFEVDQVRGASAGILLPGNWASTWLTICIIEAHCCFLNCFPVSLALGFIRTSTHSGGHQSLFDLSSWIGLHTVALAQQPRFCFGSGIPEAPHVFSRVKEVQCR